MIYQQCRYGCGIPIAWKGKTGEPRSTGWFEVVNGKVTDIEHTYARCEEIKKKLAIMKQAVDKVKDEHGGGLEAFSS